ncbi:MAG: tetratricopeptide repeat protein [Chloroflexia bacterium]
MANAPVSFGQWLKQARNEMGFTQKELADMVGCATTSIRKIEAEAYRPSRQIAQRLVESLEVAKGEQEAIIRLARLGKVSGVATHADLGDSSTTEAAKRPGNLPAQATRILGREKESIAGHALLLRDDVRLLTLTGAPGIGKTRLALDICGSVVDAFADGIFFVPLAPITDPALVASTIARILSLQEAGDETAFSAIVAYLQGKQILLILDNFEQVADAAPVVAGLLAGCVRLKIVVTSREVLHLSGEHQFPVPPLSAPDVLHVVSMGEVRDYAAVRLFVERATEVNPLFVLSEQNAGAVTEICARLDGLPLAIEIAAARTKLFSPQDIQARLASRLGLLTSSRRDLPDRQQTVRKAIDWSYQLLNEEEQILFARMSVFADGCTLAAVSAVCDPMGKLGIDVLDSTESLLDKSLLRQRETESGEGRLSMLEILREYALERLETSKEAQLVRSWHAQYYIALAEAAEPELVLQDQLVWLNRLEQEHNNLRAALDWLLTPESIKLPGSSKNKQLALRLSGALWRFWLLHGHLAEGRKWLERAISASGDNDQDGIADSARVRAKALHGLGGLAFSQGDLTAALHNFGEALVIWKKAGEVRGAATTLSNMGLVEAGLGNDTMARLYYEECLVALRELGDKGPISRVLNNLGILMHDQGDLEEARKLHEESLLLVKELGNRAGIGASATNLGLVSMYLGDYAKARELLQESLDIAQELGSQYGVAGAYTNLSVVAYLEGDHTTEIELLRKSLVLQQELGNKIGIANCLEGIGAAIGVLGYPAEGVRLMAAGGEVREAISAPLPAKDRARYEQSLDAIRVLLTEERFAEAWAEGRRLPIGEAAALSLAWRSAK